MFSPCVWDSSLLFWAGDRFEAMRRRREASSALAGPWFCPWSAKSSIYNLCTHLWLPDFSTKDRSSVVSMWVLLRSWGKKLWWPIAIYRSTKWARQFLFLSVRILLSSTTPTDPGSVNLFLWDDLVQCALLGLEGTLETEWGRQTGHEH